MSLVIDSPENLANVSRKTKHEQNFWQCTLRTSYREIIISHLLLTRHQTYPKDRKIDANFADMEIIHIKIGSHESDMHESKTHQVAGLIRQLSLEHSYNATYEWRKKLSKKERRVDALAPRAEERRDKLRKAAGRSKYPVSRRYLNGETRLSIPQSSIRQSITYGREPGELKHLSSRRKRKKHRFR